jgi:hypothetical protein
LQVSSALHIAHCFLETGACRRGMIVNCEAGFRSHLQWTFASPDELEDRCGERQYRGTSEVDKYVTKPARRTATNVNHSTKFNTVGGK